MASEIRVDKINSLSGVGTVTLSPTGVDIAGITTVATFKVGTGVTASSDGDIFATGVCTATTFSGSGANLTNLDASDLASGTVPTARLGSGTASSSTFLRGDSTFQTVNTDLVSDTSPQLGGDLDTNSHNISLDDSHYVYFGNGNDLRLLHDGNNSFIQNDTGNLVLAANRGGDVGGQIWIDAINGTRSAKFIGSGAAELYHNGTKQCETSANGLAFPSGKGIDFSAVGDGAGTSSVSELLDSYEEGVWTGTMNTGTATVTNEKYVKVGRMVHVCCYLHSFSDSTSSSIIQVNGLPFTSDSNHLSVNQTLNAYITTLNQSVAYIGGSLTNIRMYHYDSGGDYTSLNHSAIASSNNSSRRIFISATYVAAS